MDDLPAPRTRSSEPALEGGVGLREASFLGEAAPVLSIPFCGVGGMTLVEGGGDGKEELGASLSSGGGSTKVGRGGRSSNSGGGSLKEGLGGRSSNSGGGSLKKGLVRGWLARLGGGGGGGTSATDAGGGGGGMG